jgi:hypothetical protein|tara:strand:- start:471 stop:605 length:135 start_codon:yes stop_codon:yes gene_type:complete
MIELIEKKREILYNKKIIIKNKIQKKNYYKQKLSLSLFIIGGQK